MSILVPAYICADVLPAGTNLEARFSTPTGSRISHPGDPVAATVIAPVFGDGRLLVPQGATLSGSVKSVDRLGLGFKHLTSAIEYGFNSLQIPNRDPIPITAHVVEVETAKERVDAQGGISGIFPTANLSSSLGFALPLLWIDPEVGVPMMAIKFVIARSPDPEIYFPAGTEVILRLTTQAIIPDTGNPPNRIAALSPAELAEAQRILAGLPQQRTNRAGNHPSDLVNTLFLGGREPLNRAFQAAGWDQAQRSSLRSIYRMYHCMVQRIGYRAAPMGRLTLNGLKADLDFEKGLNTFSKRHHVRLWKEGQGNAWLGAATEDVGYRLRRMHLTHATDPLIDNERSKVLNDLAFTGCLDAAILVKRKSPDDAPGTEASLETDRKIAVLRLNDCQNPQSMMTEAMSFGPRSRPRYVQALIALRNDMIRMNPISIAYNTAGALRHHQVAQRSGSRFAIGSDQRETNASESIQPRWRRPTVLDSATGIDTPEP